MQLLLDSDILVYRIGFASEEDDENIAVWRCNDAIERIIDETEATSYRLFLTNSEHSNFRYEIYPQYKSGRGPKPKHYETLRRFMQEEWRAEVVYGQESDDAIGIAADLDSIIASIDKDLLQIPGLHYNFVKKEFKEVDEVQGMWFFYKQLLTGDAIDNIPGLRGIGAAKSTKILYGLSSEDDMFNAVKKAYLGAKQYKGVVEQVIMDDLLRNGRLLKIRQQEGEIWEFPVTNET